MNQSYEELMTTYFVAVADFMESHPELLCDAFDMIDQVRRKHGFDR